jgi:hypothetical protein
METSKRKSRYQRVMMFFVLMFLALQLLGVSSHTHDYTDHAPDCAACAAAHLPAGTPPPPATVVPVALLVSLPIVVLQSFVWVAQASYLTPPSHAPPGVAVFSF